MTVDLLLIGLFKLAKAIFFFSVGVGAIHMLHKDLEDEVMRLAVRLKFDPESRFVALLLDKVDLIDAHGCGRSAWRRLDTLRWR